MSLMILKSSMDLVKSRSDISSGTAKDGFTLKFYSSNHIHWFFLLLLIIYFCSTIFAF